MDHTGVYVSKDNGLTWTKRVGNSLTRSVYGGRFVDVGTSLSLITKRNQRTDGSSISPDVITIGAEGATTVIENLATSKIKTDIIEGVSTTGTQSLYGTKTGGILNIANTQTSGNINIGGADSVTSIGGTATIVQGLTVTGTTTINAVNSALTHITNLNLKSFPDTSNHITFQRNGNFTMGIDATSNPALTIGSAGKGVNIPGLATLSGGATISNGVTMSGTTNMNSGANMNSTLQFTAPYQALGQSSSLNFTNTNFGTVQIHSIIGGVGAEAEHSRLRFVTASRESLTINTTTGRVGILNFLNPGTDLDVNGSLRYISISQNSDRRIKKNIVDIDDMSALTILRKLKPKTYEYIDQEKRTEKVVFGFIAQDVKEELDYAVLLLKEPVPNIFSEATVTNDMITFTTYDTSNLLRDASNNLLKLVIKTKTIYEYANIVEILDQYTLRIDRDLLYLCENGTIFVYGQEVNDFHTLNKEVIWTVATAALQEVDRQLQAEKQKTALMQTALDALLENKTEYDAKISNLEARLLALESNV